MSNVLHTVWDDGIVSDIFMYLRPVHALVRQSCHVNLSVSKLQHGEPVAPCP